LSGRQGQGHQTQPNLNGQLNVYMCKVWSWYYLWLSWYWGRC